MRQLRLRRIAAIALPIIVLLAALFSIYLWGLYGHLKEAFVHESQFIPTRIYSDVIRIAPPHPLSYVRERLKSLGYAYQLHDGKLTFSLRPVDYPVYLLPEGHPVLEIGTKPILLHFDGGDPEDVQNLSEVEAGLGPATRNVEAGLGPATRTKDEGQGVKTRRAAPPKRSQSDPLLRSIEVDGKDLPEIYLEPELVATLSRSGITDKDAREVRALVNFNDIPAKIWQAIIAVEDPRFLEHKGLDPRGLARAVYMDLLHHNLAQGGSTLTLQLVKNLTARRGRNIFKKFNELFLALLLEATYDKEQILERYLNEVNLGQVGNLEIHGVVEGAEHFFGKKLDDLNLAEIAFMAGLIRGPDFYSPYRHFDRALERQRFVLQKMVETGQIAEEERDAAEKMPIRLAPPQNVVKKAPYFTDFVKAELVRALKERGQSEDEMIESGYRVYTTLDMRLNADAQRAVADGISRLETQLHWKTPDKTDKSSSLANRLEGALASVEPSSGYIRALVGGKSYSLSTFNRILNMKRQIGSTFKPIVYLSAFVKGKDPAGIPYGPGHPADDAPWTLVYDHGKQSWSPRNYEKEFLGWISFRQALAHSINTVAAKVGYEVGIPEIIKTARALGISSELPNVPSLALGVAELSPIELLNAYSTIANHGLQEELTVIRAITRDDGTNYARFISHSQQVIEPGPADLLTDMMQNVFTEGTASTAAQLGFDRPAAGKTGTTSHYRDAWFAGFTPQLATVVWVGADIPSRAESEEPDRKKKAKDRPIPLTGANSALPVWVDYMRHALAAEPELPFPLSAHLVDVQIDTHSGETAAPDCPIEQLKTEKYVKGLEPQNSSCLQGWPAESPASAAGDSPADSQ